MKLISSFLSFLPLLWLSSPAVAQIAPDSVTLERVVALTLNQPPAVQQALEEVQAAQARMEQTLAANYPTVEGWATYTRLDPVATIDFSGHELVLYPHDNLDFHVGTRHSLYDFGRRAAQTELSRRRLTTATDAVDQVRINLVYTAVRAFYGVLYLDHALAVQEQELAALNEHLNIVQRKISAGTALNYDILTTQVRVATVENQRADTRNASAKQLTVLRQLLGLPADAPLNLKGNLSLAQAELKEDSLTVRALQQRTEMRLSQDAEAAAQAQLQLARTSDRPNLGATAQYGFKNGYVPNIYALRGNWVGGAQLNVPIFNGQRRHYLEREAEANVRGEQQHRNDLERRIRAEIGQAIADVQAAGEKLQNSEVRIQQAEEAVTQARSRYTSGTLTSTDVLDAETALAEARLVREQALYAHALARTSLRQAVGDNLWQP